MPAKILLSGLIHFIRALCFWRNMSNGIQGKVTEILSRLSWIAVALCIYDSKKRFITNHKLILKHLYRTCRAYLKSSIDD